MPSLSSGIKGQWKGRGTGMIDKFRSCQYFWDNACPEEDLTDEKWEEYEANKEEFEIDQWKDRYDMLQELVGVRDER